MRLQSIFGYTLIFSIIATSLAFAQPTATDLIIKPDKIFDPNHISLDSMQAYEKIFTFDWNNYDSIEPNKKKIDEIEMFLKTTKSGDYSKLSNGDKQAFGRILYRLGTFYTHISRQQDLAIERLNLADNFLQDKQDKAWNYNHLAYAYEQKYASSGKEADKNKTLFYINKVISGLYRNDKNKQVAFAYCIKGLLENDMATAQLAKVEDSFKNALQIYEHIPEGKDDQYAMAKHELASIILAMNRDDEAIQMLQQLKQYWLSKKDITKNPYAAKNFLSLGQAYLKIGKAKDARDEIQKAVSIYQNIYGDQTELLKKPYQLLSEAYKILGDQKLANSYEEKANALKSI